MTKSTFDSGGGGGDGAREGVGSLDFIESTGSGVNVRWMALGSALVGVVVYALTLGIVQVTNTVLGGFADLFPGIAAWLAGGDGIIPSLVQDMVAALYLAVAEHEAILGPLGPLAVLAVTLEVAILVYLTFLGVRWILGVVP